MREDEQNGVSRGQINSVAASLEQWAPLLLVPDQAASSQNHNKPSYSA
jgi:hypothetical protein